MPAGGMHPHQSAAAHRRYLGTFPAPAKRTASRSKTRCSIIPKSSAVRTGSSTSMPRASSSCCGRTRSSGSAASPRCRATAGWTWLANGKTQTLEAKNIIVATGSEARMMPGLEPDPEFILTNIEILDLTAVPKIAGDRRRGRGGRGVWVHLQPLRHQGVASSKCCRAWCRVEDEEISKELERVLQKERDSRGDRRQGGQRAARPAPA